MTEKQHIIKKETPITATRIKEARKKKGFKQVELALKMDVPQSYFTRWEVQGMKPDIIYLKEIAKHCGVSVDWLLGTTDIPTVYSIPDAPEPKLVFDIEFGWPQLETKKPAYQKDAEPQSFTSVNIYDLKLLRNPEDPTYNNPLETLLMVPTDTVLKGPIGFLINNDSMVPTLNEHAKIGVDHKKNTAIEGKIYVIRMADGSALVRRLFFGVNEVILKADNSNFPEIKTALTNIQIIGTVGWVLQPL